MLDKLAEKASTFCISVLFISLKQFSCPVLRLTVKVRRSNSEQSAMTPISHTSVYNF